VHSLNCQNDLSLESGSLTLGASSVIAGALTMAGAVELGYGADVLVGGLFTCAYGQLSGPGTLTASGGLALSGESLRLTGGTLVNAGHATWTSGNFGLEQDAAIVNGPGALFDVQVDRAMTYQGTQVAVFTNNGTFRKSAGPGTASLLPITFNNAGTVELDSGTLSFEPSYSLPGSLATWTGTVTGADGTTLILNGPLVLQEGSSLSVPSVVFNGGTVTIAGQYQATVGTSTTTGSPSVSFTGRARVDSAGAVSIDSGTIDFSTGAPVTLPSLTLSTGGELAGSDDVLVSGMLTVIYGFLRGPGTVTASGGLAISATGGQLQVSGCALVNTGYARWTGGNIGLGPDGSIENRAGARFEVPIDQFAQLNALIFNTAGSGPAAFVNAGTFHVSSVAGTGTVRVQSAALDNAGVIQVDGGTLFLQPNQERPAVWAGAFTGGPGSTLVLAGPHDLQASSTVSGPAVQFASPFGPVTIAGHYNVTVSTSTTTESPAVYFTAAAVLVSTGAVSIDSGTISFSTGRAVVLPSLTLAVGGGLAGIDDVRISGPFTSTGGRLSGPGMVTADGGLSLSGDEEFLISGCTLVNTGAATWSGGPINTDNGAVLSNTATGTFEVTCDALFYWCGQGPDGCSPVGRQPAFQNAGTFVKSAGPGITDFRGLPDLGGMDVSFVNTGTVEVRTGQVAFGRTYTQTAGSLLLTGGSISALGTLDLQAGALSGTGTVTANVQTAAALSLGADIGTLTVGGDYTQLPAGQLTIRLGGLATGTQYDQLIVSGTASLAGTLALALTGGFTPAAGTVFTVMTYGAEIGSLAVAGGGQPYTVSYAATALAITAGGLSGQS
jgi:fibronectin-binding autotransporter adhesin